jgi:hypothetical protein
VTEDAKTAVTAATEAAKEVIADPKRLGISWTLRPGKVVNLDPFHVTYDGDSAALDSVNLTGNPLPLDRRVMGLLIPPSGSFIIGKYGADVGELFTYIDGASTATPSAAFSAETEVLRIVRFTFEPQRAYKIEFRFDVLTTSGTNAAVWRIRKTSTVGTLLGIGVWPLRNIQSNDFGSDLIVRNTGTADVADAIVLTMASTAGNITANAAATQVGWIRVYDMGPSSRFANAIAV